MDALGKGMFFVDANNGGPFCSQLRGFFSLKNIPTCVSVMGSVCSGESQPADFSVRKIVMNTTTIFRARDGN